MTGQLPLETSLEKAIGRDLKGYVVLGGRTGIVLVFDGGLTIELRSLREIEAVEIDPEPHSN